MHLLGLIGYALLASTPSVLAKKKDNSAILLSRVKSLTLRDGQETSHRRVKAMPQLSCVGGNAKGLYVVDVMRCHNSGSEYDAEDIQWTCKADLPSDFKLGSTEVICEGYDNADDPYVLKGSCGVEYRLVLTPQGEEKYRDQVSNRAWRTANGGNKSRRKEGSDTLAAVIFWVVFGAIICAILYSVFYPNSNNRGGYGRGARRNHPRGGGGGGGGYDDGYDDPPPPYTPRGPSKPKSASSASRTGNSRASNSRQQDQGWRPGFWSGTATGAAAGYAAGSWANRQQDRDRTRPGTSSWFGGNSGGYGRSGFGGGGGGGSSSSGPTPSSSRHESTGFGGTSRR